MTLLPKRPQIVANLRLNLERVNAAQIISCKRQNRAFAFCTLRFVESVTEEGEFSPVL